MSKKYFFKELVPDIIIALGFFLLFTGLFNLFQEDNAGSKAIVAVSEIQDTVQESEESKGELSIDSVSIDPEEIVRDLSIGLEDIGIEELVENRKTEEIAESVKEEDINKDKIIEDIYDRGIELEKIEKRVDLEKIENIELELEEINIIIPEGSSGRQVARIMDENNLIPFDDFIQLILLFDIETRIKAGEYTFTSDSSVIDILARILIKERR